MPFVSYETVAGTRWLIWRNEESNTYNNDNVTQAILMDIREELKRLNTLLQCDNFRAVPSELRRIARNTMKPRKKKAAPSGRKD